MQFCLLSDLLDVLFDVLVTLVFLLESFLPRAKLSQLEEFIFDIRYNLLILRILVQVRDLFIMHFSSLSVTEHVHFFWENPLKLLIPLNHFFRCSKSQLEFALMSHQDQSSEISWLLYYSKPTLERHDIDDVSELGIAGNQQLRMAKE